MSEQDFKQLARLTAIEFLLISLMARQHLRDGLSTEDVERLHKRIVQDLQGLTAGGGDAAISNAYAAEVQEAVEGLLGRVASALMAGSSSQRPNTSS